MLENKRRGIDSFVPVLLIYLDSESGFVLVDASITVSFIRNTNFVSSGLAATSDHLTCV